MYAHVPHLRPMDTPVDVQQAVPLLLTAVMLVTSLIHSLFMTPKRLTGELMVIATKELAMMVAGLDMMYHVGNVSSCLRLYKTAIGNVTSMWHSHYVMHA